MPMNLQLDDVALLVRVVELGTLSAAARERNLPVSQISRAVARLEADCGVRLLHRNTHGLSLTDEGDTFVAHARRLLDTQAELQAELSGKLAGPSGWVRLSVSAILAEAVIAPALPSLYQRHPGLHLDICADDRMADMAREGIDMAIRTGTPHSELLVARHIGTLTRGLYAAPAYLAQHGQPSTAADLAQHRLIGNSSSPGLNRWQLQSHTLQIKAHTRTDNTAMVLALVRHGVGIARLVDRVARPLVAQGVLVEVLGELVEREPVPMFAVMLQERHRLPKVRACIDHWAQWLADEAASALR